MFTRKLIMPLVMLRRKSCKQSSCLDYSTFLWEGGSESLINMLENFSEVVLLCARIDNDNLTVEVSFLRRQITYCESCFFWFFDINRVYNF